MTIREFTCAICRAACLTTTTTEAEASREFLASGQHVDDETELASVCDDCYTAAMTRVRQLGVIK